MLFSLWHLRLTQFGRLFRAGIDAPHKSWQRSSACCCSQYEHGSRERSQSPRTLRESWSCGPVMPSGAIVVIVVIIVAIVVFIVVIIVAIVVIVAIV